MVPMLDFFNHQSSARPRFGYDPRTDVFSVAAEKPYLKGEQVYITYGDKNNDDLLLLYGFIGTLHTAHAHALMYVFMYD
jgi:hypothetical protein